MKRDNDRQTAIILSIVGIVPVIWLALLIAPSISGGLPEIAANLATLFDNPFSIKLCEDSLKTVLILLLCYGMGIGIYFSTRKNYRRREEHGSAKWGNVRAIDKKYRQKPLSENKLMTQNVCIGLNAKKHRRNLNTLVCGGSGAGKTRFYATNTVQRSVKTAEQTAKTSIKTTKEAAIIAQKTAKTTAKATQKAAQTAKKAAKATADTVKATAKATVATVKAIIAGTKALVAAIAAGGWIAVLIIMIVVLFGAAVAMFGGGSDSNSYTPVSAEVEAYEPIIQKYAKEYGIPEYVELIKAVMMQESGGRGLDPMQAAEGSFNTRYPHEPNGIKDPEYSIQCGVQELKAALTSAEVESPIDMEHIKLALQGYNFGNGYISWAKTKYGGYSYANAVEFSTQQAQRLGWDSYGDTQYPAHVLRYYPYGRAFTAGGNQAIVEVALTQLGNQGGQPYWSWYGFNSRVEWCACFVSWCADQCGYIESGLVPKFAGCVDGANWFKSNGKWQDRTYEPKVGDIIFFDWEGDGTTDHVGIVEKCENGTVYTVEGNSGDACKQRQYAVGSSNIYGYGIPSY